MGKIIISKKGVESDIANFRFDWDYIAKGGKSSTTYINLETAKYAEGTGLIKTRNLKKNERNKSGLVLTRLPIQVYEDEINYLDENIRKTLVKFDNGLKIGIWENLDELLKEHGNGSNAGIKKSIDYVADMYLTNSYSKEAGGSYYFYNIGLYDSIIFAKQLLELFGDDKCYFELEVSQKNDGVVVTSDFTNDEDDIQKLNDFAIKLANKLVLSKNLILNGAPGTGKTYLSKEVAAYIVSDGRTTSHEYLSNDEKSRIGFVQFHPSYDYTDFVEGLRPSQIDNGISFKLEDGIFKKFCINALEDIKVPSLTLEGFTNYLLSIGKEFYIPYVEQLLGLKEYRGNKIENYPVFKDINDLLENYDYLSSFDRESNFNGWIGTPINYLKKYAEGLMELTQHNYVFIIDEINRGEISKILGELFFSIDPGYRGEKGRISTQYSNMGESNCRFYVPENVYIIGTMNDIDRSVDTFDFAMRRRFRFIEIDPEDTISMIDCLEGPEYIIQEAKRRQRNINKLIASGVISDLSKNYQIGSSYFLKIQETSYDYEELWNEFIKPLLSDYLKGGFNEEESLDTLHRAYKLEDDYGCSIQ